MCTEMRLFLTVCGPNGIMAHPPGPKASFNFRRYLISKKEIGQSGSCCLKRLVNQGVVSTRDMTWIEWYLGIV